MNRLRLGATLLALACLAVPDGAFGYRFFGSRLPDGANRWQPDDFPLRFRMLENDYFPTDIEITREKWTGIVSRSLDRWTEVPTAEIALTLEGATVERDRSDAGDGINTIGFSLHETWKKVSWATASASLRFDDGDLTECDINVNPDFVKNWSPQDSEQLLEIVATHEIGHCLGLAHTEPHPMPLWTKLPVGKDAAFLPDPVMSYSNSYGLKLSQDEITAVSLLYPAPSFLETRGTASGIVRFSGGPAVGEAVAHAYVQAVRPGGSDGPAGPGPGAFTSADGFFSIGGLPPGDWMLWVHPILVVRRSANSGLLRHAEEVGHREFADRLRWVRVTAGRDQHVEITVEPGRETSEWEQAE